MVADGASLLTAHTDHVGGLGQVRVMGLQKAARFNGQVGRFRGATKGGPLMWPAAALVAFAAVGLSGARMNVPSVISSVRVPNVTGPIWPADVAAAAVMVVGGEGMLGCRDAWQRDSGRCATCLPSVSVPAVVS